ncbi:MAG: T9SS type A sorting domain-containing protein [Flavobacteriales bacterium]
MMIRYTSSLSLVLLASVGMAQPTLSSGNSSFVPGESYLLHQCDYFTPPANGVANATWDHSDLVSTASVTDQWVTPVGGAPVGTTVSESAGGGAYAHYKATAAAFEQVGLTAPQATLNCTNGVTVFAYPFTFGTVVNDTYACTGVSAGESFTRTGTVDLEGASWGTLILPYGTFTNVLMVDVEQHHEDVFASDPDFPFYYNAFTQLFIKPGVKEPLLANYENYQVPGQLLYYARMLDEDEVGVAEAMRHDIGVDLMPNPATERVEVVFGVAAGSSLALEVIDLTGKVVLGQRRPALVSGIQREVIDISSLASGAYTVRITDANGSMGAKRLIVQ